ncbi:hypothetical protein GURASL_06370 [Geotalea uraniireducens]|uniref:DAC domain-containing protein n=1 Tax=Geotalea uraniireducens TaxID=351604 RepID=A0ABN6VP07_9BACT|nr:hypothetical protein [Geotalea uraniireducens]BDV41714.1 hypothetical protein GURASL_06370 [Geotalea uraniireducens]
MPIAVFDAIRGNLQTLLGGARVSLVRQEGGEELPEGSLRQEMVIDDISYLFTACRPAVSFTKTEEIFCGELLAAFSALFSGFRHAEYAAHFRTALLASLTDISVARFLRGDHRKAFWPIQQLIQLLKNLSYQRYEGKPATTGFLIHRTKLPDLRRRVQGQKCRWFELHPHQPIAADFFDTPLTYRFVDGTNSLFVGNIQMQITGVIKVDPFTGLNEVDRLTHQGLFRLLNYAGSGAFAIKVNEASEIEVIISPDKLLVRRRGQWEIFDPDIFRTFLAGSFPEDATEDLIWTLYALSKTRHGTVVLIHEGRTRDLAALKRGSVGGDDPLGRMLMGRVQGKHLCLLKQSGELGRLLSSDGMTVFSSRGKLLETGLIIDTSHAQSVVTGGGRTTAASAASYFGKVIKVSEDGPIELFRAGKRIYRFG